MMRKQNLLKQLERNFLFTENNEGNDDQSEELVYADDEMTSCDITPFLGEYWELTTDITKVNHTKISEIPFYQYTHLAFDPESKVIENNNVH